MKPPPAQSPTAKTGPQIGSMAHRQNRLSDVERWRPADHAGKVHVAWSTGRTKHTDHPQFGPSEPVIVERMAVIDDDGKTEWYTDVEIHQQVLRQAFLPDNDGDPPPSILAGIPIKPDRAWLWDECDPEMMDWLNEWLQEHSEPVKTSKRVAPPKTGYREEPF